jgi:hypothetical protein
MKLGYSWLLPRAVNGGRGIVLSSAKVGVHRFI